MRGKKIRRMILKGRGVGKSSKSQGLTSLKALYHSHHCLMDSPTFQCCGMAEFSCLEVLSLLFDTLANICNVIIAGGGEGLGPMDHDLIAYVDNAINLTKRGRACDNGSRKGLKIPKYCLCHM